MGRPWLRWARGVTRFAVRSREAEDRIQNSEYRMKNAEDGRRQGLEM